MSSGGNAVLPEEPEAGTVIVAETDILARMVLAQYLRECGYDVIEAATSDDVVEVLRAGRHVDAILLDALISGGLAGFTLARHVREHYPQTDIVLTFGVAKTAEKAGDLCDKGPLEKPYHPEEIVRRIKTLRQKRKPRP